MGLIASFIGTSLALMLNEIGGSTSGRNHKHDRTAGGPADHPAEEAESAPSAPGCSPRPGPAVFRAGAWVSGRTAQTKPSLR
jgi:hypothetical protein